MNTSTDSTNVCAAAAPPRRVTENTDPAPAGRVLQGFLEDSNVEPVQELARMVEVQRAYELGQGFLDREDDGVLKTIQATQTR